MEFNISNKGKTPKDRTEAYYEFDPVYSMKEVSLPFQTGEPIYTLKEGYCYIVDPEARRNGGDDATRGYTAVIDQKGEIVADFIEYDYDSYRPVLEGKLAVAELLSEYDNFHIQNGSSKKLDFHKFTHDIFEIPEKYRYLVEEKDHDEYIQLITDSIDRRVKEHRVYFEMFLNDSQKYLEMVSERFPDDVQKEVSRFNIGIQQMQELTQKIKGAAEKNVIQKVSAVVSKVKCFIKANTTVIKETLQKGSEAIHQIISPIREGLDQEKRIEAIMTFNIDSPIEKTYCKAFLNGTHYSLNPNDKNDMAMRSELAMRELILSGEYSDAKISKVVAKLNPMKESVEKINSAIREFKSRPEFKKEQSKYQLEHGFIR